MSQPEARRFRLKFLPAALEEWQALDGSVKTLFKKLLAKRADMAVYRAAIERLIAEP